MQKKTVQVILHLPKTDEARQALAERVAEVHAGAIQAALEELSCSTEEKRAVLRQILQAVQEK